MTMLTLSAMIGMPRRVSRMKARGACPSSASENSIRAQENRPLLPAESSAVMMTKFMMSGAKGMPTYSNTVTNGLSVTPVSS